MKVYANGVMLTGNVYNYTVKNITADTVVTVEDVKADVYTVKYIVDGENYHSENVKYSDNAQKPKVLVKTGYTFDGWFVVSEEWNFANDIESDLELVAKFTPLTYRLTVPDNQSEFTVNVTSANPVEYGGSFTFDIIASEGYNVLDMMVYANGDYVIETRNYDFGDTESNWAKDYISFVAVRGKINGVGNNQFAPNKNVTRAEFLKMIFGALNIEANSAEISASDVSANDWYAPFVAFAMQNGIVKGYEDGTFKPNNEISREEMMVMLNRCIEYKEIEAKSGKISFSDKYDISDWAKDAVANITALGLITGNDDGTLKARSKTKRCECAVVMMRCIKLVTNTMIQ